MTSSNKSAGAALKPHTHTPHTPMKHSVCTAHTHCERTAQGAHSVNRVDRVQASPAGLFARRVPQGP